ncbi:MAG: hypothetical protein O3A00_11435 [Planctomycetota bacterium]|nr:hypothetical protein [Planctomycetota bacterium]
MAAPNQYGTAYAPGGPTCTACGQVSSGGCSSGNCGTTQGFPGPGVNYGVPHQFQGTVEGVPYEANSPIPDAPPVDNKTSAMPQNGYYIPASATTHAPMYQQVQQQPRLLTVPSGTRAMTVPAGLY